IVRYAGLAFHDIGPDERDQLIDDLADTASAFSDSQSATILRAWSSLFKAQKDVSEATEDADANTTDEEWRQAFAPADESIDHARSAIAGVRPGANRDILDTSLTVLLAFADRFKKDIASLSSRMGPLLAKPQWTELEAPLILSVTALWAVGEYESSGSATAPVPNLTAARTRTMVFWKTHPALTTATEFLAQIAAPAGLRTTGRAEIRRLAEASPEEQKWTVGPLKLAQYAFQLGDDAIGLSSLIKGLKEVAARDDVQSEAWRKFISAKIGFILTYSNSTQQLNVITSLLDDEALLPPNSPARRWALLTAAEYYAKLGEATTALALRKQVSQMPLPADTDHLLSSSNDPAALEKAAFDLDMKADLPAQARLLERAIELRGDAKTLADATGRLAVSVLVEIKSEIGESQDIQHHIDAYYDAVTRQELPPPPDERLALDQPLIETIAGLETFTHTLGEIGTGTDYNSAIQTIRDAIVTIRKNRLRTVLRLMLSGGKSIEDVIMQVDLGVSNIVDIKGPAVGMVTYGEVVFPVLFGPDADSRPWTDWNVLNLFQLVARSLHSAGADFPAGRLYLTHADFLFGSEPKWTAQGVCVDLANTLAGALADASYARWRGALRLPCNADVPTAAPTAT
ncbi:MAG: hypothetical protein QOE96_504, partial [Blastocatellia bacterium]|nr:hypothetical protein [Blastocatellia bacterium]